jgi:hypothetical protein
MILGCWAAMMETLSEERSGTKPVADRCTTTGVTARASTGKSEAKRKTHPGSRLFRNVTSNPAVNRRF